MPKISIKTLDDWLKLETNFKQSVHFDEEKKPDTENPKQSPKRKKYKIYVSRNKVLLF